METREVLNGKQLVAEYLAPTLEERQFFLMEQAKRIEREGMRHEAELFRRAAADLRPAEGKANRSKADWLPMFVKGLVLEQQAQVVKGFEMEGRDPEFYLLISTLKRRMKRYSPQQIRAIHGKRSNRSSFVFTCARNLARDLNRKERKRPEVREADMAADEERARRLFENASARNGAVTQEEEEEDQLLKEEREQKLREAIALLPKLVSPQGRRNLNRDLAILRSCYRFGNKATAERFGIVPGRVSQIVKRMKALLRKALNLLGSGNEEQESVANF